MNSESKLKYECIGGRVLFTDGEVEDILLNPHLSPRYERDTESKPNPRTPIELDDEYDYEDWWIEPVGEKAGIIRFRKKGTI